MTRLTMTTAMVEAIEYLEASEQELDDSGDCPPRTAAVGSPISHGQVITIARKLRKLKDGKASAEVDRFPLCHLDDLLRGSKIYVQPTKAKAEKTLEYQTLMARLRREEEDKAYERMINPPLPAETFSQRFPSSNAKLFPAAQADIGDDDEVSYTDINRQISLIINVLVSIVACSVAIWLAARHWSTPSRLGLSMGGSGMIGVAEVVVYAGYLRRIKEAKEKGKKEVEIKEIVKTWVIGREKEKDGDEAPKMVSPGRPDAEKVRKRNVASDTLLVS